MDSGREKRAPFLLALALVAALIGGFLLAGHGDEFSGPLYRDPAYGWTVAVPKEFTLKAFHGETLHGPADGAVISNFGLGIVPLDGGMRPLTQFPASGAAVMLWRIQGIAELLDDDATFPLGLENLDKIERYVGGDEPVPRYGYFSANGIGWSLATWLGEDASPSTRSAARAIVSSIRFPPLREGTIASRLFWVLGETGEYPVGTVTMFDDSELPTDRFSFRDPDPFFLIHAPGGFYALSGVVPLIDRGSTEPVPCMLEFDPKRFEFVCPRMGARWDRVGSPENNLAARELPAEGEVAVYATKIAHDQHVLVSPFFNASEEVRGVWE